MDYREIQEHLQHNIEQLQELQSRLSGKGEPLRKRDKKLIRFSLSQTILDEHQSMSRMAFLDGDLDWWEKEQSRMNRILEEFA